MRASGGLPGGGGKESTEEQGQGKEEGSMVSLGEGRGAYQGGTGFFIQHVGGVVGGQEGRWAILEDEAALLSLS